MSQLKKSKNKNEPVLKEVPKFVYIRWLDAGARSIGWESLEDFSLNTEQVICETGGFLLNTTEDYHIVGQTLAHYVSGDTDVASVFFVPKNCVLDIREIKRY